MNLTPADFASVARELGVHPAALMAVAIVESPAPHVGDSLYGPLILNERHWFSRLTRGRFDKSHPHLSSKTPGGYQSGSDWIQRQRKEHARLSAKVALDREAALKSVSIGLFQIMGFNHTMVGYPTVSAMWADAAKKDDRIDLTMVARFIKAKGLDDELRGLKWDAFARLYNGPNYAMNRYHTRLAANFTKYKPLFEVTTLAAVTPEGVESSPDFPVLAHQQLIA